MRIISGLYKGRRFNPPLNKCKTRPTMDMAKEALFNILYNSYDFPEINALDLFSGTGSIGFEFVSRGCKNVTLVENYYLCNNFISEVKNILNIENELKIIKNDALKYLSTTNTKFDIIFADPPYDFRFSKKLIDSVFNNNLLNQNGIFIYEHDKRHDFSIFPNYIETKTYGTNKFSTFK